MFEIKLTGKDKCYSEKLTIKKKHYSSINRLKNYITLQNYAYRKIRIIDEIINGKK